MPIESMREEIGSPRSIRRVDTMPPTVTFTSFGDDDDDGRVGRAAKASSSRGRRHPSPSPGPLPGYSWRDHIQDAVDKELEHPTPLTKAEQSLVDKGYLLDKYVRALKIVTKIGRFRWALRCSGIYSCICQDLGSPVKAHDVEEKSIKDTSLENCLDGAKLMADMKAFHEETKALSPDRETGFPLLGRVGHWKRRQRPEKDELLGFYVSPKVAHWKDSQDPWEKAMYGVTDWVDSRIKGQNLTLGDIKQKNKEIDKENKKIEEDNYKIAARNNRIKDPEKQIPYRKWIPPIFPNRYYVIEDVGNLRESMRLWLHAPDFPHGANALALSGDQDLLDARYPRDMTIVEGSRDEKRLFTLMNLAIAAVDKRRPLALDTADNEDRMLLFPHGTQRHFLNYSKTKEPYKEASIALTQVQLPVAAFICEDNEVRVFEFEDTAEGMAAYLKYFPLSDALREDGLTEVQTRPMGGFTVVRRKSSSKLSDDGAQSPRKQSEGGSSTDDPGSPSSLSHSGLLEPYDRRTSGGGAPGGGQFLTRETFEQPRSPTLASMKDKNPFGEPLQTAVEFRRKDSIPISPKEIPRAKSGSISSVRDAPGGLEALSEESTSVISPGIQDLKQPPLRRKTDTSAMKRRGPSTLASSSHRKAGSMDGSTGSSRPFSPSKPIWRSLEADVGPADEPTPQRSTTPIIDVPAIMEEPIDESPHDRRGTKSRGQKSLSVDTGMADIGPASWHAGSAAEGEPKRMGSSIPVSRRSNLWGKVEAMRWRRATVGTAQSDERPSPAPQLQPDEPSGASTEAAAAAASTTEPVEGRGASAEASQTHLGWKGLLKFVKARRALFKNVPKATEPSGEPAPPPTKGRSS